MLKKDLEKLVKKQVKELKACESARQYGLTKYKKFNDEVTETVIELNRSLQLKKGVLKIREEIIERRNETIKGMKIGEENLERYNRRQQATIVKLKKSNIVNYILGVVTGLAIATAVSYYLFY